jgi:hypothetical protein
MLCPHSDIICNKMKPIKIEIQILCEFTIIFSMNLMLYINSHADEKDIFQKINAVSNKCLKPQNLMIFKL